MSNCYNIAYIFILQAGPTGSIYFAIAILCIAILSVFNIAWTSMDSSIYTSMDDGRVRVRTRVPYVPVPVLVPRYGMARVLECVHGIHSALFANDIKHGAWTRP